MASDPRNLAMALLNIQPTQLYISGEKLKAIQTSFDFSNWKAVAPIPVKMLNSLLIMTDGHTRVYGAYLAGLKEVPVVWDEDPLDWEAYQICVDWCQAEGIRSIAGLHARVVCAQEYQEKWLDRCRKMQAELFEKREKVKFFP